MNFTNQEPIDCPICLDVIGDTNNIITECGHKFHASCIMINIVSNGFNCPCCRFVMVKNDKQDDEDDETVYDEEDATTDYDESTSTSSVLDDEEPFSEDSLRGLRLLTNLLEGIENDQQDLVEEYQYNEQQVSSDDTNQNVLLVVPTLRQMCAIFRDREITYDQLVAWSMLDHDEYQNMESELERYSGDIWGHIRTIVSNYNPESESVSEPESEVVSEPVSEVVSEPVSDHESEVVSEPVSDHESEPISESDPINNDVIEEQNKIILLTWESNDEDNQFINDIINWFEESKFDMDVSIEHLETMNEEPVWWNNQDSLNLSMEEIYV
jgi:hypothetical protein